MSAGEFIGGIWCVDFEFYPRNGKEGNVPVPVCLVAKECMTGRTIRLGQDELSKCVVAPFPTDLTALFVAFYAADEFRCFIELGWPMPHNIVDLFSEFRCFTNGKTFPFGNGLIGALSYFGLDSIAANENVAVRDLVLRGAPWTETEKINILDYCETDVEALANLLPAMWNLIDWPRALLRGQYSIAAAKIEFNGVPLDVSTLDQLREHWESIRHNLINVIDKDFGVYEGGTFKITNWEKYLTNREIAWPRLASGGLDMRDETFKGMCSIHPQLHTLRELRGALSQMRLNDLQVGEDGRNRCMLSIFRSKTGRNQPSTSKFIFGPSVWMRGLIKPSEGHGIAYVDWSQQEFGIAAALSGDVQMMTAYCSGDPYLSFAKQTGAAPSDATKQTHKAVREQFKAAVLAVQYGMGAESLAMRINQPVARARQLLELHKRAYSRFWQWSDSVVDEALLGGKLWTTFGWQLHVGRDLNDRSLRNFPIQANGAEMLRLACIQLSDDGILICAPVHDALLIEAPLEILDAVVAHTQSVMAKISAAVLNGFTLQSDAKIVRFPDRYMDDRGAQMWNTVMALMGTLEKCVSVY